MAQEQKYLRYIHLAGVYMIYLVGTVSMRCLKFCKLTADKNEPFCRFCEYCMFDVYCVYYSYCVAPDIAYITLRGIFYNKPSVMTFWSTENQSAFLINQYQILFVFSSKILHKQCFNFLLGLTMVPRETGKTRVAEVYCQF